MLILGIFDGAHDTGACVVQDGRIVAAVNEERFTRAKMQGSFPSRSIAEALHIAGVEASDVDAIGLAGVLTPQLYFRLFRVLQRRLKLEEGLFYTPDPTWRSWIADFVQFRSGISDLTPESWLGRVERFFIPWIVRRDLPAGLKHKPIQVFDHHHCHAAGAYYCSGFDPCLSITADGVGDGVSFCVNRCEGRKIERLHAVGPRHSIPVFYALITTHLGFIPFRDEGKVLGLSARGNADNVDAPFPIEQHDGGFRSSVRFGLSARPLLHKLERHSMEDVAAWLQTHSESLIVDAIAQWAERTGLRNVALAGGLFANVRLNQLILALPQVDNVYVFPQMGDGGLAAGAGLALAEPKPVFMGHVFLGPQFSDDEIERELKTAGLPYEQPGELGVAVAKQLAAWKVVARFAGRMEYGPRALGNRSILVTAEDPAICDKLNSALGRSRFMPFAPATPVERANECYTSLAGAERAARFMTITFDATERMRELCPAVVHVDGTARAQIVDADTNPGLHKILTVYGAKSGRPSLLNTSFNMHEEPIVCTPADAVDSFQRSGLDWLAIGSFLARQA